MCYPKECNTCGKTTWGGCGLHKETVLNNIPEHQRCGCQDEATSTKTQTGHETKPKKRRRFFTWRDPR